MLRFPTKPKWYQLAAKLESESSDIIAGSSNALETSTPGRDEFNVFDLRQARKLEGYAILMRKLRVAKGYTIEKLARKLDVDQAELIMLESRAGFKASPRTMSALAEFYGVSFKKLLQLSGVTKVVDEEAENAIIRFAADSESFEKLTGEEKVLLNKLVKVLSDN